LSQSVLLQFVYDCLLSWRLLHNNIVIYALQGVLNPICKLLSSFHLFIHKRRSLWHLWLYIHDLLRHNFSWCDLLKICNWHLHIWQLLLWQMNRNRFFLQNCRCSGRCDHFLLDNFLFLYWRKFFLRKASRQWLWTHINWSCIPCAKRFPLHCWFEFFQFLLFDFLWFYCFLYLCCEQILTGTFDYMLQFFVFFPVEIVPFTCTCFFFFKLNLERRSILLCDFLSQLSFIVSWSHVSWSELLMPRSLILNIWQVEISIRLGSSEPRNVWNAIIHLCWLFDILSFFLKCKSKKVEAPVEDWSQMCVTNDAPNNLFVSILKAVFVNLFKLSKMIL